MVAPVAGHRWLIAGGMTTDSKPIDTMDVEVYNHFTEIKQKESELKKIQYSTREKGISVSPSKVKPPWISNNTVECHFS